MRYLIYNTVTGEILNVGYATNVSSIGTQARIYPNGKAILDNTGIAQPSTHYVLNGVITLKSDISAGSTPISLGIDTPYEITIDRDIDKIEVSIESETYNFGSLDEEDGPIIFLSSYAGEYTLTYTAAEVDTSELPVTATFVFTVS